MGFKALCFGLFCVSFLSYIYTPIPDNIEETWKVMALDAAAKTCTLVALCLENMGVMRYEEFISMIISLDYTQPFSDEHVTVTDTDFVDIPVRLYLPKRKSEAPRRAVIYFHGGGFCFGSFKQRAFDFLNRCTASKLDAVVVGMDLCLTGHHIFQVQIDPEVKHKLKLQALLYPGLQVIDTSLPSHQDNEHGIVLTRDIAIKLVSLFFTKDEALPQAMRKNQHMPLESRHLFRFVNWSVLLPDKYRKDHMYTEPELGRSAYSLPALMDHRALPLLADDARLQHLPRTYILTCQYDVLRDDGIMYVTRLQNVGVQVFHDHVEDGIHGALSYMTSPLYLQQGLRIKDMYISWLDKNL
ncbi:Aadacl2 [Phodopus roborovskii]|uniref:Aadacl2 protein n=1 Tax=Phodopus roborovskii TaxID=109678 RepID=A0AAU9YWV6_PHORO|nr:Aadacl2 [Phodopus roborovskii]